jgi:hypothetical protein
MLCSKSHRFWLFDPETKILKSRVQRDLDPPPLAEARPSRKSEGSEGTLPRATATTG